MTTSAIEPWHGTTNGYNNRKCRCEACRAANAEYHKRRRAERSESVPFEQVPHGANGYRNYGCRRLTCLEGHREERGGLHPRPPAECGTNRGYHAHWYRNEPACADCRAAHSRYECDRRAAAR